MTKLLYDDEEWTFERLNNTWDVIEDIAKNKFKLDFYKPQIEVITSEQLVEKHGSHCLPVMYDHWSFGRATADLLKQYKEGHANLAYEVVINTDPCIAYLMENNDMTTQALVLAHASCGHSAFFKNNYLFKEHTSAKNIIPYLEFAKKYVNDCYKEYGEYEVSSFLDLCHSIEYNSIDRYPRRRRTIERTKQSIKDVKANKEELYNHDIEKAVSEEVRIKVAKYAEEIIESAKLQAAGDLPEENLLYFIEKNSLILTHWQRELCRIVRRVSQYFYPQILTKVMNEGYASFWHYTIMNELADEGYIPEGSRLRMLRMHSNVLYQPDYTQNQGTDNPYQLGYSIFADIKRICQEPDEEDKQWFPDIAGTDWIDTIHMIMENYQDSSFIANFLGPKVIRKLKLFMAEWDMDEGELSIAATHTTEDLEELRERYAKLYEWDAKFPSIEVIKWDPVSAVTEAKDGVKPLTFLVSNYTKQDVHEVTDAILQEVSKKLMGTNCRIKYRRVK